MKEIHYRSRNRLPLVPAPFKTVFIVLFSFLLSFNGAEAADFTVSTPAEFQSALTSAQGNGEPDTIHVVAGIYSISTSLSYATDDGDGDLSISALDPTDPPLLDGGNVMRMLYIKTDTDNDQIGDANITITLQNLVFQNGKYSSFGGGLFVQTAEADILIKDCRFSGNTADYTGGGAYAKTTSGSVNLINNMFSGNIGDSGGGAYAKTTSGSVTLTGNRFIDNTATASIHPYGGGAFAESDSGSVRLSKNTFFGNNAHYGGGAAASSSSGLVDLSNNIFSGNTGYLGGGAFGWSDTQSVRFTNNTLWENTARYGGGLYTRVVDNPARIYVNNNIIRSNSASVDGDDLYVDSDGNDDHIGSNVYLRNNDLGSNSNFNSGRSEDMFITYTDHYLQWNNITVDPRITASGHIPGCSPVIDAGICGLHKGHFYIRFAPYDDIDGDKRPGDEQESGCDIGADEYHFSWPMFIPAVTCRR